MNPGLQKCNPTDKFYVTATHSLLYRVLLPRQQVAPAITQKHRGLPFLASRQQSNAVQEYSQAVTKCRKVPLHNYPVFLFICAY